MAILIDADVILQAERGLFDLEAWLVAHPHETFKVAAITVAELWHGAASATGPRLATRQLFLRQLSDCFDIVPYTSQTAFEHARLWAEINSGGQTLGTNDLILAATAIQTGNALATFNKHRFTSVKGLHVIEPA